MIDTQTAQILAHFQKGKTLTFLEAIDEFGTTSLHRRLSDLKERGHSIESEWIRTDSGKRVKRYRLAQ